MRVRHFFLSLVFCALAHTAAAAAPVPTDAPTGGTDGCEVAYVGDDVTTRAVEYVIPAARKLAVPAPLDLKEQSALDEQSYSDVYAILKDENSCSRFFGGPSQAVEAFNELARRLKRKPLRNRAVGVRMSGTFVTYKNHQTGATYRLFQEATVNSEGPLFKQYALPSERKQSRVGSFQSATRQGRALMFLHELGHVVAREDGEWVLPNDGDNYVQSERNTRKVEETCSEQLTAIE